MGDFFEKKFTRREVGKLGLALGATMFLGPLLTGCSTSSTSSSTSGKDNYPKGNINVSIPSESGGELENVARAHSNIWAKELNTAIAFDFNNAASGEVAYTSFTRKTPDGYNLMFGNIEPFVVMYATQAPKLDTKDLVWACTLAVDPGVIVTNKESKYKSMEDLLNAGQTVNVAVAHWASMDTLAAIKLSQLTGLKVNIVPYGGGKKANLAIIQGEIDCYFNKLANSQKIAENVRYLSMIQDENSYPELSDNCPTLSKVINKDFPEMASVRNWIMPRTFVEKYPERYKLLMDAFKKAYASEEFKTELKKVGTPLALFKDFKDEEWTKKRFESSYNFAMENKDLLKQQKETKK